MTPFTLWLTQVKARLSAATPGPWHYGHQSESSDLIDINGPDHLWIAEADYGKDSSLIVNAPTDLARAIEALEICRAETIHMRDLLADIYNQEKHISTETIAYAVAQANKALSALDELAGK